MKKLCKGSSPGVLIDAEVGPGLVRLLCMDPNAPASSRSGKAQADALSLLKLLAADHRYMRRMLVDAQAAKPLVNLLERGPTLVSRNAAAAVSEIALGPRDQVQMLLQANVSTALVQVLKSGNEQIVNHAAAALDRLSEKDYACKSRLVAAGAVDALSEVVRYYPRWNASVHAESALANLYGVIVEEESSKSELQSSYWS